MGRTVTIAIGTGPDATFTIDLDEQLEIHDPDAERFKVAADVAWWGTIAARARARAEAFASEAEHWKNAALKTCVETDEKMAEWKAKAQAQGHDSYRKMLQDVAKASEEAGKAEAIHWAFVRKMDMLNAMIVGENGTRRASGGIGQVAPKEAGKPDTRLDAYRKKHKAPQQET